MPRSTSQSVASASFLSDNFQSVVLGEMGNGQAQWNGSASIISLGLACVMSLLALGSSSGSNRSVSYLDSLFFRFGGKLEVKLR